MAPRLTKRIRLTGTRFEGGRLPVDSLVELQRYQDAVRTVAEHEWQRDHPDEELPEAVGDSASLTIEKIEDGSADILLAFEQVAIYEEYQAEARNAVDATIRAAYMGEELPSLPTDAQDDVRQAVADIGRTLEGGQSIEFYLADDASPVTITVETRPDAVDRLHLTSFLLEPLPGESQSGLETHETAIVAHITAIDADQMAFVSKDLESRNIRGRYRDNPDLLEDLRAVVDSEREGPLTRITGELQYRGGEPWRFKKTYRIERVEFDQTMWGAVLTQIAGLPRGWAAGEGHTTSLVALDAAQSLLRSVPEADPQPTIGPTEEGGILIEWIFQNFIRSIEVLPDGTFELFAMNSADRRGTQSETTNVRDAIAFATGAIA